MKAGAATQIINNELGTYIQGAHSFYKVQYIRDDLEANALWLESDGNGILFIGVDLGMLELDYVQRILPDIAEAAGVPANCILIGCSHTHSAPCVVETHPDKPIDRAYHERLREWLCQVAKDAVSSAEQVTVAWGEGQAEIGYNRRVCYADGLHEMHGDPCRPDATGLEGSNDPQHTAIFVRNLDGRLKAIFHHNTAHPVNFYCTEFLSADFPGQARKYLRDTLGDIPVVFFNGAIGDMSIFDEAWKGRSPETAEQRVARAAHLMTGETLRLLQHADFKEDLAVGHTMRRYDVRLRSLTPERLEWCREEMAAYQDGQKPWDLMTGCVAYMTLLFHEQFGERETETIDLHAVQIGDLAFVAVPCEIFCHFALQTKRRSPFLTTVLLGLTSGSMGYCPTMEGIQGGSHEGTVKLTSRWDVSAGYLIVDELCRMLYELHGDGS